MHCVSEVQSVPAVICTNSLGHDWAKPSVCLVAHPSWKAWGEARESGKLFTTDLCRRASTGRRESTGILEGK